MLKRYFIIFTAFLGLSHYASAAASTTYSYTECEGSAMPYPVPDMALRAIPDSLTPVYVNHIGRHGARFLSSGDYTVSLLRYLHRADSLGTITPAGRRLMNLCHLVTERTDGRWGALDSLGMAEQRGIASRLYSLAPALFHNTDINAISSYVPRCIASMDEFTHQLSRLDNRIEITTASGRQNSPLLRPWTGDESYKSYIDSDKWHKVYSEYVDTTVPTNVAIKIMGAGYPFSKNEKKDIAMAVYKVVAGCRAMSIDPEAEQFMTLPEYNSLWSIMNMHHYLTHSASSLSSAPMDMSATLLNELITTMDSAVNGTNRYSAILRFGHAETLMPLFALMRLPGCYYITDNFDTVALHWLDFQVVPMAANLQMILLRARSGKHYVRFDLNERPVPLLPGEPTLYIIPWESVREYLTQCLPSGFLDRRGS